MSKVAVIKTGGKQYHVKAGDTVKVEKLKANDGDKVNFDVLMTADDSGKDVQLGTPVLGKAKVEGKVLEQGRAKKIKVVHYKNKTRQYTANGHRQPFTKVEITSIS